MELLQERMQSMMLDWKSQIRMLKESVFILVPELVVFSEFNKPQKHLLTEE